MWILMQRLIYTTISAFFLTTQKCFGIPLKENHQIYLLHLNNEEKKHIFLEFLAQMREDIKTSEEKDQKTYIKWPWGRPLH